MGLLLFAEGDRLIERDWLPVSQLTVLAADELCVPVNIDPVLWYDIVGDCDFVAVRQSVIERDWLYVSVPFTG